MKCMIVEDEPLALKQIQAYIEKTPFLKLSAAVSNALDAYEIYAKEQPDVLFVDINMPEVSGMEFVKSLKNPCMVIFTTAYSEYAIESYKVDAIDYLLKPISYSDFLRAANKAYHLFKLKKESTEVLESNNDSLFVKSEHKLVRLKFSDIKYIEGMREYVRIHTDDGSAVMTLLSMKSLEERLPSDLFMRVHRSFIVQLNKIKVIERQRIVFDKNTIIPIGEQYKECFENYISKKFM